MSFILDAIKKSEKERRLARQNEIHSFQDEVIKTPRSKKSLFILKAFLIVSFILFIFFVYFFSAEIKSFYSDISNKYLDGLKAEDVTLTQPIKDKTTTEKDSDEIVRFEVNDPLPNNNLIKELWELPLSYQKDIPNLNFELHIYSEDSSERTIIINNRRMKEGQLISSGLTLKKITETGVILHKDGIFFHIDIIENW
jgi:general secretion pathway protein B